jgi:uncharacterized damage-inducible protein DinB
MHRQHRDERQVQQVPNVVQGQVASHAAILADMTRSPLADAFAHHAWATRNLIDSCADLSDTQLQSTADGVYGSMLDTFRHMVSSDRGYLTVHPGVTLPRVDDQELSLADARTVMEENAPEWQRVVSELQDPDRDLVRQRPDGSGNRAPAGIRLAQALHHGTDHRSQIATILTTLEIQPPDLDVWEFARSEGRIMEFPADV